MVNEGFWVRGVAWQGVRCGQRVEAMGKGRAVVSEEVGLGGGDRKGMLPPAPQPQEKGSWGARHNSLLSGLPPLVPSGAPATDKEALGAEAGTWSLQMRCRQAGSRLWLHPG